MFVKESGQTWLLYYSLISAYITSLAVFCTQHSNSQLQPSHNTMAFSTPVLGRPVCASQVLGSSSLSCPRIRALRDVPPQTSLRCPIIVCRDLSSSTSAPASEDLMRKILSRLREDVPNSFSPKGSDYSMYSSSVEFEDPLNKFQGTDRHAANIRLLSQSPIFKDANLDVHDSLILPHRPNIVRTRWTLSMTFNAVPWHPRVEFTGQSDYVVNLDSGLIVRHVDYWDSLDDSSYFSFPALKDFLSQCAPIKPVPRTAIPPFALLRRTKRLQIWRFYSDVTLTLLSDTSIYTIAKSSHSTEGQNFVVRQVAVIPVSSSIPSQHVIQRTVEQLASELQSCSFAKPTTQFFCVQIDRFPKPIYHIWLELSEIRSEVDQYES